MFLVSKSKVKCFKVADLVFNGVRDKKFYILANTGPFKNVIRARMEDIVQERNPTTVAADL